MTTFARTFLAAALFLSPVGANAGDRPVPAADQEALLKSDDPQLAANKRVVYDLWRTVMIGGHVERVAEFMVPDYIQHNPGIPNGRDAFVAFIKSKTPTPGPIPDKITWPLLTLVAERDLVVIGFVRTMKDPENPGQTGVTSSFDMFRVVNGKVTEHWDVALR